jgi:hypothetical protein
MLYLTQNMILTFWKNTHCVWFEYYFKACLIDANFHLLSQSFCCKQRVLGIRYIIVKRTKIEVLIKIGLISNFSSCPKKLKNVFLKSNFVYDFLVYCNQLKHLSSQLLTNLITDIKFAKRSQAKIFFITLSERFCCYWMLLWDKQNFIL